MNLTLDHFQDLTSLIEKSSHLIIKYFRKEQQNVTLNQYKDFRQ
jgi:hypothetical protein